jgi:hypothetical protein
LERADGSDFLAEIRQKEREDRIRLLRELDETVPGRNVSAESGTG